MIVDDSLGQPDNMPAVHELRVGDTVEGVVTELTKDSIFLDVSEKTDACMPRNELKSGEEIKPNDTIRVKVIGINLDQGIISVSRSRIEKEDGAKKLIAAYKSNEQMTGVISSVQSHGFAFILPGNLEAFMPFSHVALSTVTDVESYVGKELPVLITKLERLHTGYDIVVSHKELIINHLQRARAAFAAQYKEGDTVTGVVEEIFPKYARVRIGEAPATIVPSELGWLNNMTLSKALTVGESITAKIIMLSEDGRKIFLSMKELAEDPWLKITDALEVGSIVEGTVEETKEFGIFACIEGTYQGLIHTSEISWENENYDPQKYTPGQQIKVKVLAIDPEQRRMALSMRQVETSPWDAYYQAYANKVVTATVKHARKFGLICSLTDEIEGYLPHAHISWGNRAYNPAEFTVGEQIKVAVIGTSDKYRKVRISLKMCQDNPWDTLIQLKREHAVIEVTVSHKHKHGLRVSVGDGVEGFINANRISNFDRLSTADLLAAFSVGDVIEATIITVDKARAKIYLATNNSEKARKSSEEMEQYMASDDEPTAHIADLTDWT